MSSVHSLANYLRHAGHASASSLAVNRTQKTPSSENLREGTLRVALAVRVAGSAASSVASSPIASPLPSPLFASGMHIGAPLSPGLSPGLYLPGKPRSPSPLLHGLPTNAGAANGTTTNQLMQRLQWRAQPKQKAFRLHSGQSSAMGKRPTNQDETLIVENLFGQDDHALYAVFDGHGSDGGKAAAYVKSIFVEVLENYRQLLIVEPIAAVKRTFREVNDLLVENEDVDTYMSGTTASIVIRRGQQLILAHLGDSRIVLGRRAALNGNSNVTCIEAVDLTVDHNCYDPRERERVIQSGARVQPLQDGADTAGPLRIFKGSLPYPGIVVSRSLGDDVAQRLGVLCEPDVTVRQLSPNDRYLVLATDGVWDGMTSAASIALVDRVARSDSGTDAALASQRLNDAALTALDAAQVDDNVSNICVFIQYR